MNDHPTTGTGDGRDDPPSGTPSPANGEAGSFEAAYAELEAIVANLEEGKLPLDESVRAFERGGELLRRLNERLTDAELRVKRLMRENGVFVERPEPEDAG